MKILYLNNDKIIGTGSGNFLNNLLNSLKKNNPNWEYSVLVKKDLFGESLFFLPFYFFKIRNIFKKFDIIHALDGWPYGFIAIVCSIGLKNKIIITGIGTGAVQPLYKSIKKYLLIWAYKRADNVTTISTNTKKEILKIIPNLNIEVINHGVDFEKFQRIPNKNIEEINKFEPYILSIGALKKRKGLDYSIKVFAEISKNFPNLNYVIVGKGPEREKLTSLAEFYGLSERITMLDRLQFDFLVNLYRRAKLFILLPQDDNKDMEGFGLVFLEAAACGLPVIGSINTSADDAILNNENGFLVNLNEAPFAVSKILENTSLSNAFSEKSIEFSKLMSWDKAAGSYLKLYQK